jgi:hypothetical protein
MQQGFDGLSDERVEKRTRIAAAMGKLRAARREAEHLFRMAES